MTPVPPTAAWDPQRARAQFPIFATQPAPFHYLDNAATGQACRASLDALIGFEAGGRANVKRGVHRLADAATVAYAAARASVAAFLGVADADEVVITGGATAGLNVMAFGLGARLRPGDAILVSELEHHSNLVPWQLAAERAGAAMLAIPVTPEGRLNLDRLNDLLTPRVKVVAVTHASNVTGAVTDVARIAAAAHAVGAVVVVDGAQRTPHGPVDVPGLGCDAYAVSAHKMFGTTGAGALWIRPSLAADLPPLQGGGEMIREVRIEASTFAAPPHRFEAGTPPIGPALAMGAAAGWLARQDAAAVAAHELALTGRLLDGLGVIAGVRVVGPAGLQQRLPVVAFEVDGVHAHDVCQLLDQDGVALRGGHHCAQPLAARFGVEATARASLALYNDQADVDALLRGLDRAVALLR